jgi:formylmethanofuran dehydrogenase subunit C
VSALTLRLRQPPPLPVDAAPLQPARLAGLEEREIAALPLRMGNRELPLGELFDITRGDPSTLVIEGDARRLHCIGGGMAEGRILVEGDAGHRLAEEMAGGSIEVRGSVGDLCAAAMKGGLVRVQGDAGHRAANALPGERQGMKGGALIVGGRLGERPCDRMRRGLVLAEGGTGYGPASRIIGGTVVLLGPCGDDPAFAMRRGTLLLAQEPERLLATFEDNGAHDLPWLALLRRYLESLGWKGRLPGPRLRRLTGCASAGGVGEILLAA